MGRLPAEIKRKTFPFVSAAALTMSAVHLVHVLLVSFSTSLNYIENNSNTTGCFRLRMSRLSKNSTQASTNTIVATRYRYLMQKTRADIWSRNKILSNDEAKTRA